MIMDLIIVLCGIFFSTTTAIFPGSAPENYYDVAIGGQDQEWGQVCELLNQISQLDPNFMHQLHQSMEHQNEVDHLVVDECACSPTPSEPHLPRDRQIDLLWKEMSRLVKEFVQNKLKLTSLRQESEAALRATRLSMDSGVCTPAPARRGRAMLAPPTPQRIRFPTAEVLEDQIRTLERMTEKYETLLFDFILNKSEIEQEIRNSHSGSENDANVGNVSPTVYTPIELSKKLRNSISQLKALNIQARDLIRLFSRNLENMTIPFRSSTARI